MSISRTLALLLITSLIASCDYVEDPLADGIDPTTNPTGQVLRKVLLEEYTGHRCTGCPSATALGLGLQANLDPGSMILVGLHVTSTFADPLLPDYPLQLRVPIGLENAVFSEFPPGFQIPKGLVNRTEYNNSSVLSSGDWSGAVATLVNTPADVSIEFDTVLYNSSTGQVSTHIKIKAINGLTGDHHCVIYLVEDHIIGPQIDNVTGYIPNYDHRHVVRNSMNSPWGEVVFTGGATAGDSLTYTSPVFPMDPSWDVSNCSLVAFVHNNATKEILQVEEAHVTP